MDFIANDDAQLREMLKEIGAHKIEDLFAAIPDHLLLDRPQEDDGISEFEGMAFMESLGNENTYNSFDSYLGAGAYEHHIPAIVAPLFQRGEFLTAYTSYQPEVSQGVLQAIFEYQTAVCELTGMDVSNASLYDGASACAEAVLMTLRQGRGRKKLLIAGSLHPHYRGVVDQYLTHQEVDVVTIPFMEDGSIDSTKLYAELDDTVASVLVSSPNFFGVVEDLQELFVKVKECGALSILCANPLSYGVFASAGELGADVAVGDMQPFGMPLSFGGPYAGYIACRQKLLRQMPGRIVGQTKDVDDKTGYVITLQAREQHIRRAKATSNICTNQALMAIASIITMVWYGSKGVKELALTNYQRAAYLRDELSKIPGVTIMNNGSAFNEFVVAYPEGAEEHFMKHKIILGLCLGNYFEGFDNKWLVAVTETKTKEQLDHYLAVAREL